MQIVMKTIVAKGSDYSVLNVRALENSKIKDITLVLIYPSGFVYNIQTCLTKLIALTESLDSLIYYNIEVKEMFDSYNEMQLNALESQTYEG